MAKRFSVQFKTKDDEVIGCWSVLTLKKAIELIEDRTDDLRKGESLVLIRDD